MVNKNVNDFEGEVERRLKKREKRKKQKMKVSGGQVKKLQKIIKRA